MKFLDLQINGFGKFHNQAISFEDGLNVIYGKNETGKSTIHTFIRGMLFGMQPQRGRTSENNLYSKYEPWENSSIYEGSLRLEHEGTIYRIERCFQKSQEDFRIFDETAQKEVEPAKELMDRLLNGLSETAYNNTISIGQLKSATDEGMVSELKNYIANINTSGNMALNVTKACNFLNSKRTEISARLVPDAARSYTSVLGEIKALEKEIASPAYENQIPSYQKQQSDVQAQMEQIQTEKDNLMQQTARGREVLTQNRFSTLEDIKRCREDTQTLFTKYEQLGEEVDKTWRKVFSTLPFILASVFFILAALSLIRGVDFIRNCLHVSPLLVFGILAGGAVLLCAAGIFVLVGNSRLKRELAVASDTLGETFSCYLDDFDITQENAELLYKKLGELELLCNTVTLSEETLKKLDGDFSYLQTRQADYGQVIESQQKSQWELEKKLEQLSNYKTRADALRSILAENEAISQELSAIDLALETLTGLSVSIRDSFGLYLNKTASELIQGITGGVYTSMGIDENLNPFLNTKTRLVPLEQVSSGTMDQIYLALRLAAAKLIQGEYTELMPLIFDDSFVLYDDERLKNTLKWLPASYSGQILLFTCHQREAQMLTASQLPYRLISL